MSSKGRLAILVETFRSASSPYACRYYDSRLLPSQSLPFMYLSVQQADRHERNCLRPVCPRHRRLSLMRCRTNRPERRKMFSVSAFGSARNFGGRVSMRTSFHIFRRIQRSTVLNSSEDVTTPLAVSGWQP